ncbi:MAG: beta-propeller fold lactonase family protein, partial [Acidobacteria bacterium]|nr:beta-propeller fold lactonase family protein [Acidobacteriota bacterium]
TDFLVQSNEAINIPFRVRVSQNHRNAEATGDVRAVAGSISTAEGLVDMAGDSVRQRLYIANSGLNRVEVFDMRENRFLPPIKVGQLPRSVALTPNGKYLYVANSGGESISIVDLDQGQVTGKVKFPPVAYNASFALNTPSVIAATLNGPQIVMFDGTLWRVVDNEALPRKNSVVLGTSTIQAPRTLVATPGGEYAMLLGGNGTAYLYEAAADNFILSQSVVASPIQGYFGPVAAGPQGRYFVVNGRPLNSSLTPLGSTSTSSRPVAAVAAVGGALYARFSQPIRSSATAVVSETPTVELVDANTGLPRGAAAVLEGPLASQVGNQRVNTNGRTMAVDSAATTAYLLTTSGLSIVPLGAAPAAAPILINQNGVVNGASFQPSVAPGSMVSIFGQNLASTAAAGNGPLPNILGGVCVTLGDVPLPLYMTSASQINAQIPPGTKTGSQRLLVRSIDRKMAGLAYTVNVRKYALGVFINAQTGQAAVFRANGTPVSKTAKAKRDESLALYATGLGATHGGTVSAGEPAPSSPLAETDKVQVYFGNPKLSQSEMIVDWSGLVPGLIGIYQINLRVPGVHEKGDELPVTLRIGGVDSPTTGTAVPTIAVE